MPGMNIVIKSEGITQDTKCKFDQIQNQMLHLPSYSYQSVLNNHHVMISYTSYGSYPIEVFKTKEFVIVLEGLIYNLKNGDIEKKTIELALAIRDKKTSSNAIRQFLIQADGEFVIAIYDKINNELNILNDIMGRLPLYYYQDNNSLIVSREIKFIVPFLISPNLNKDAIMEYLLFGFAFSENTLMDNIFRLKPATQLSFNPEKNRFLKEEIRKIDFDNKEKLPKGNMVNTLKKLFLDGLKNRIDKTSKLKPIISLSGGLDSRATLAGLLKLNIKPEGITNPGGGEEKYAKHIAKDFNIDITQTEFKKISNYENYNEIVFLKDGLNSCTSAKMIGNLTEMYEKFGDHSIMFTGLMGGEILRYSNLTSGLKTEKDLTNFLMNSKDNYTYTTENVCKMLNINKNDIFDYLTDYFSSYEEKNIYKKYVHFKFEKDYKWAGEGEDRNRFFFWSITPFYYFPLYQYTLSINENKKDTLLFRNFLYALDKRTCNVPYYNNKMSLNNMFGLHLLRLAERLVRNPIIRNIAQSILLFKKNKKKDSKQIEDIRQLLLDKLKNSTDIQKYFSLKDTILVINNEEKINYLLRFLTIFLYIDFAIKWHKSF